MSIIKIIVEGTQDSGKSRIKDIIRRELSRATEQGDLDGITFFLLEKQITLKEKVK